MSFKQWKNDSVQLWDKIQTAQAKDVWYLLSKTWNRKTTKESTTSTKIQVTLLRFLDQTWDSSCNNPDVVLFVLSFLIVRWDLRPYLHHHSPSNSTTTSHNEHDTPRPQSRRWQGDDAAGQRTTTSVASDNEVIKSSVVKDKEKYKDKGLYNFISQCQGMKHKLRPVSRDMVDDDDGKKMKQKQRMLDKLQIESSFLQLSPERLRNLRGNLRATPTSSSSSSGSGRQQLVR